MVNKKTRRNQAWKQLRRLGDRALSESKFRVQGLGWLAVLLLLVMPISTLPLLLKDAESHGGPALEAMLGTARVAQPLALPEQDQASSAIEGASAAPGPGRWPGLQMQEAGEQGVELVLTVPMPLLRPASLDTGETFVQVSLEGYGSLGEPGLPALPERGLLVGLPPGARPVLTVLQADWQQIASRVEPMPAPHYQVSRSGEGDLSLAPGREGWLVPRWEHAVDRERTIQGLWPAQPAVLGDVAVVRGLAVVPVWLRPVQWDAATGAMQVAHTLRVRVDFIHSHPVPAKDGKERGRADPWFEPVLEASVVNYSATRAWPRSPAQPSRQVSVVETSVIAASGGQDSGEDTIFGSQAIGTEWGPDPGQPWWKVAVQDEGLYALTPGDLEATGLDLSTVDAARLQLWDRGRQVALVYLGNQADGLFNGDDRLVWLGQPSRDRYTRENVYWLTVGQEPGLRAATVPGAPTSAPVVSSHVATARFEENRYYVSDIPHREMPDRWYGQRLSDVATPVYDVRLLASQPVAAAGELIVRLLGTSTDAAAQPDHHVRVHLNGQAVGDIYWDGQEVVTQGLALPPWFVLEGVNTITLKVPGDMGRVNDISHLDWVELRYPRQLELTAEGLLWDDQAQGPRTYEVTGLEQASALVMDISDPWAPVVVTGAVVEPDGSRWRARFGRNTTDGRRHVLVTLDQLRAPLRVQKDTALEEDPAETGADYLVITHADLVDEARRLMEARSEHGLRSVLVDVQEIYDAYADGQMDPWAIRSFLQKAYATWPAPAPAYVVLFGNGHYDYLNYTTAELNLMPPLLGCWDPWLCEVASDNRYVTLDGDDPLADMLIGRLPVENLDEARTVVDKILSQERELPPGEWQQRLLFVADNSYNAVGAPDLAGDFEALTESVVGLLPSSYTPVRVYYDPYPTDDEGEPFRHRTAGATTEAIVSGINEGQLFVNFVGHGGVYVWAHEWLLVGESPVRSDLSLLRNSPYLPVGLSMACLTGSFDDPSRRALDVDMVVSPIGGTVASWGATGFGVATGHQWLHRGFFEAVFDSSPAFEQLGPLVAASKLYLVANSSSDHDLLDTFVLLGDPFLQLPMGADLAVSQDTPIAPMGPGDPFSYTVRIANRGNRQSSDGVVLALDLPPIEDVTMEVFDLTAEPGDDAWRWRLGQVSPESEGTLVVNGRLSRQASAGDLPLLVQARLLAVNPDRNPANDQTPVVQVPAQPADLFVAWDTAGSSISPGSQVEVTLHYGNLGPALAPHSRFSFSLPPQLLSPRLSGPTLPPGLPTNPAAGSTVSWVEPALIPGMAREIVVSGIVAPETGPISMLFDALAESGWLDDRSDNDTARLVLNDGNVDAYEPDDSPETATMLTVPGSSGDHTIYPAGDMDWFQFQARRGLRYHIRVENLGENGDTSMALYGPNGSLLAKNDDYTASVRWSGLDWVAVADGLHHILITGQSLGPPADSFTYDLAISADYRSHLPMVQR